MAWGAGDYGEASIIRLDRRVYRFEVGAGGTKIFKVVYVVLAGKQGDVEGSGLGAGEGGAECVGGAPRDFAEELEMRCAKGEQVVAAVAGGAEDHGGRVGRQGGESGVEASGVEGGAVGADEGDRPCTIGEGEGGGVGEAGAEVALALGNIGAGGVAQPGTKLGLGVGGGEVKLERQAGVVDGGDLAFGEAPVDGGGGLGAEVGGETGFYRAGARGFEEKQDADGVGHAGDGDRGFKPCGNRG